MVLISKLMNAPAVLMLTFALLSSVCVVGCGEPASDTGTTETETSSTEEAGSGEAPGSGGSDNEAEGESGSGDAE